MKFKHILWFKSSGSSGTVEYMPGYCGGGLVLQRRRDQGPGFWLSFVESCSLRQSLVPLILAALVDRTYIVALGIRFIFKVTPKRNYKGHYR